MAAVFRVLWSSPLSIAVAKIALAALLGGIVGLERQIKHHPAGLRTHTLVSMGSALVMIIAELMFQRYYEQYGLMLDPTRMGAQVISGIGFLGAGTIIYSDSKIRGLTTAASLWSVACIGLAVGAGLYVIAAICAALVFAVLFILSGLSKRLDGKQRLELMIYMDKEADALGRVLVLLSTTGISIEKLHIANEEGEDHTGASLTVRIPLALTPEAVIGLLSTANGVHGVEHLR